MLQKAPELDPAIFNPEARQEVVLLVAPPACGKSTLCRKFGSLGYVRVNQDTLKTFDKCLSFAKTQLADGKSICVDNTNLDPNTRAKWLQLGREFKVPVSRNLVLICLLTVTPLDTLCYVENI